MADLLVVSVARELWEMTVNSVAAWRSDDGAMSTHNVNHGHGHCHGSNTHFFGHLAIWSSESVASGFNGNAHQFEFIIRSIWLDREFV
jgi:hypothetical protein